MTAFKMTAQLWLVVDVLAVARLTRLVTRDTITEGIRRWVRRWLGLRAFDFVTCPWCTSVWLAGGAVLATVYAGGAWRYVAYALTCSMVAGLLAER